MMPFFSPFTDTFASKVAAIEDETADASVGNVTGSNAVNVFLGIGIAWTMAAIYHESQGNSFNVPVGRYDICITTHCGKHLILSIIKFILKTFDSTSLAPKIYIFTIRLLAFHQFWHKKLRFFFTFQSKCIRMYPKIQNYS